MLFGFVTAFLSSSPLTTILSRIIMCVAVTKHYDNVTDITTLAIDDVTIPMTSQPLSEDGDLTTTSRRGRGQSLVPGVYDYESSINFDRYLQELGVSYILRQLAPLASPVVTIEPGSSCRKESGNECQDWTIKTDTLFLSHVVHFKLDEPGKDTTMDGRDIAFVVRQTDTNRWVEEQSSRSGSTKYTTTLVRDFQQDKMVVTLNVNDVTSTSFFRRRGATDFGDDEM